MTSQVAASIPISTTRSPVGGGISRSEMSTVRSGVSRSERSHATPARSLSHRSVIVAVALIHILQNLGAPIGGEVDVDIWKSRAFG